MKPNPRGVAVMRRCSFANWFLAIFCAGFLPVISASAAADSQAGGKELTPTEQWVVAQVAAGALPVNLATFSEDKRKLSEGFLEHLLMGELPGFKPPRNRVFIFGAIIDGQIFLPYVEIPFDVSLDKCQFNKTVNFFRANFTGGLSFRGSSFKQAAQFGSMKVRGDAVFDGASFEGPAWVNFARAEIAGNFSAGATSFPHGAHFNSMKVGGDAGFDGALFEQQATFAQAEIAGNFRLGNVRFQNERTRASFYGMKVGGEAIFAEAVFEGPVDFRYANFATLDLSHVSWPKLTAPLQIQMQGMNYRYIRAVEDDEPNPQKALLELAERWPYTAEVYTNLEAFFLRQSDRADADRAFITGKCRERKEYFAGRDWPNWLGSLLLYLLVGYGRHPLQAATLCAALVALGCILFSPEKMEPQNPQDTPRVYSRFWYSLGLFLPFVDLQASKVWKPKVDRTCLRNYMRLHILLGWILIPIVLAALTGIIK